ncbi:MAG: hypothetical protein ACYSR5_03885, partial [Planctomycetota bacterium]
MKPTHISLIYKSVVGCTALLVVFVSISCSSKEDEDKKDQTAPPAASEEQTVSTEAAKGPMQEINDLERALAEETAATEPGLTHYENKDQVDTI